MSCLEGTKHTWVFHLHLSSEVLAMKSGSPLYLSKGNCKRVDRNRRQKEKEVGGVAIQGFANQAEKSCSVEEPKSLQAKSSLLPYAVQAGVILSLVPGKMETELVSGPKQEVSARHVSCPFKHTAFPLPRPFLTELSFSRCLGKSKPEFRMPQED